MRTLEANNISKRGGKPYLIVAIVLLTLSILAIATLPSGPNSFFSKLEWRRGMIRMVLSVTNCELQSGGNTCESEGTKGNAILEGGDRLVDLEGLGNRDAALGAEIVVTQAVVRGGYKFKSSER
jgi:hypothetical protein